ncbi:MAG: NAD(P)/FAD-dependent oxidoreductase [Candidatus Eiseniibacteriota bacterium]
MDSATSPAPSSADLSGNRPARVVIVGAGFGGLAVAMDLARAPVDITVIDRRNYHLFQPLLYQVATAGLSPADIAWPIRSILRDQKNVRVLLGRATGVDVAGRAVLIGERRVPYDFLVLATGARHAYFGHDDWETYAPGLKKIDDATEIRRRILLAFERAEMTEDPAEHERLLTFVIVGGGPTGVELAGTLAELAKKALAADFRHIDAREAHVLLVEAGPRILPSFPERLSAVAERALKRLGVDAVLGQPVTAVDSDGVDIGGKRVRAATVLWAAGVAASPAGKWLGVERDNAGRIKVADDMSVPGHPEIFAVGDTVLALGRDGRPLPGVAPVAKQQGSYVARVIKARLVGGKPPKPFRYVNAGNLATIGRRAAVIDFGFLRLSGWLAWWIWGIVHIYFLIGMRNRIIVATHWLWSYLTFQRGARLITGADS